MLPKKGGNITIDSTTSLSTAFNASGRGYVVSNPITSFFSSQLGYKLKFAEVLFFTIYEKEIKNNSLLVDYFKEFPNVSIRRPCTTPKKC